MNARRYVDRDLGRLEHSFEVATSRELLVALLSREETCLDQRDDAITSEGSMALLAPTASAPELEVTLATT